MERVRLGWEECAEKCYFESHMSIQSIAAYINVSRQSISAYLKKLPDYQKEKESRKAANAEKRKEYKRMKNREYRAAMGAVTQETMRREHDVAALILSREKYY